MARPAPIVRTIHAKIRPRKSDLLNYAATQRRVSLAALAALLVFVALTSGGAGAAGEAGGEAPSIYEARAGSSGPAASRGEAHYGMGGSGDSGGTFGLSKTSVSAETATVRSVADVVLNQVRLGGGLIIGSVIASAEATADGTAGGATNTGSVTLHGLTLSGVPLTLRPDTLQAGEQKGEMPNPEGVNPALASAGISIRRLPDTRVTSADGTESRLDLGGYEIRIDQPDREFHARFILGKVSVLARAVRSGS